MATKKHLCKALRIQALEIPRENIATITRVQAYNGKRLIRKVKKGFAEPMHKSNPYRRLKRAYKRNQLSSEQIANINAVAKQFKPFKAK